MFSGLGINNADGTEWYFPQRLTLVDRSSTYAHNDPAGAYPQNDFFDYLVPFLNGLSGPRFRALSGFRR